MLHISRSEAKRKKLKHYYTGKPCTRGHIAPRRVSSCVCIKCDENHREDYKSYYQNWQRKNADKVAINNKKYRDANRDSVRASARKWHKDNPAKSNAATARYRAAKIQATPQWADHDKIQKFYEEADRMSKETGVPHEVDHIYPLQGELVCGLHVHQNLQVITQKQNRSKGNKC